MSLVTSTAFQHSPAVQTRAFITLGTLAVSDVDDDMFYQIIITLRKASSETRQSDTDMGMILSMLRCFSKLVPSPNTGSRFFLQLFWLGIALLETGIMALFVEAVELLKVALENMMVQGHSMSGAYHLRCCKSARRWRKFLPNSITRFPSCSTRVSPSPWLPSRSRECDTRA